MKLLTRKQQDDILAQLAACQIIAYHYIDDIEAFTHITKNLTVLSFDIGGSDGAIKVCNTVLKFNDRGDTDAKTPSESPDVQSGE